MPLVVYGKDGTRHVVGKAIVNQDGSITAQITKDHVKDFNQFFRPKLGEFSLAPKE